jgi:CheY-like chemotaxis protein
MNPLMKNAPQIAYIESEPDLRSVITGTLQRHGFAVSVYETSKSFLPDFEVGLFDLIYSGTHTPKIGEGFELFRQIRKIDPGQKYIFGSACMLCSDLFPQVFPNSDCILIKYPVTIWVLLSARLRSI